MLAHTTVDAIRPIDGGWSVSEDGKVAEIILATPETGTVTLRVPTEHIDALMNGVSELFHQCKRAKVGAGYKLFRQPTRYSIITHQDVRGALIFGFDHDLPTEVNIVIAPPAAALSFGRQVIAHAADLLTPDERTKALNEIPATLRPSKLILPR